MTAQAAQTFSVDTTRRHPQTRGELTQALLLMSAFAVVWAIVENAMTVRLRVAYDVRELVWCRYGAHLLIVWMIWGVRHPSRLWQSKRIGLQLGRSVLMLIMPLGFFRASTHGVPVANFWGVFWLSPLLIMLLANVLLRERASWRVWVLTSLAVAGGMLILAPHNIHPITEVLWPVIAASSFSLYVVLTRMLRDEPLSANLFYTALGVFAPLTLYVPRIWITPHEHDAVVLFAIGAVGLVALFLLDRAAEHANVSLTAGTLTLQVASASLIARHGAPSTASTVGLVTVFGAVASLALISPSFRVVRVTSPGIHTEHS